MPKNAAGKRRLRPLKELLYDIFIRNTDLTIVQFFRGILSDMLLLHIFVEYAGLHYLVANTIAFVAGTALNYILSILWVFTKQSSYNRKKEFTIFALIGLVGLALNSLFMWMFTDGFGMYYMMSKIITTILVYVWNFFSRKYIIFK